MFMFVHVHEGTCSMMLVHVRTQRQYIRVSFRSECNSVQRIPGIEKAVSKYVRRLGKLVLPQTTECISHADNTEVIANTGKGLARQRAQRVLAP